MSQRHESANADKEDTNYVEVLAKKASPDSSHEYESLEFQM